MKTFEDAKDQLYKEICEHIRIKLIDNEHIVVLNGHVFEYVINDIQEFNVYYVTDVTRKNLREEWSKNNHKIWKFVSNIARLWKDNNCITFIRWTESSQDIKKTIVAFENPNIEEILTKEVLDECASWNNQ